MEAGYHMNGSTVWPEDGLRQTIRELEAEVGRQHDLHDRAEIARKALYQRAEQAEAELAALKGRRCETCNYAGDISAVGFAAHCCQKCWGWVPLSAGCDDWTARAEEGPDEPPTCPECHVCDVLGTGTKHTMLCSHRAEEGSG